MVFGLFRRRTEEKAASAVEPELAMDTAPSNGPNPLPVRAGPSSIGPPLWQDVAYGMTQDEVRTTRADVHPAMDVQRLHDGASSLLEIPSLRLADHDYSVLFYFKDPGLTQVTIATKGSPSASDFEGIANALRVRYGREVLFKNVPGSFSSGEWLSADGVNVALVFHEELGCLNINFQYRYAGVADQL